MEEYVQAAVKKGLKKIIFLEHMEVGIRYFERVWLEEEDFDRYFEEGKALQKKYRDHLEIGLGVEVGYNPQFREELKKRLARYQLDLIGLSYHFAYIPELDNHLNLVSRKKQNVALFAKVGCKRLLNLYFEGLIEAVDFLEADFLCHLDAALRFQPGLSLSTKNRQQIDTLLTRLKANNMALEINTSGFSIRQEPFPNRTILAAAMEKGIPFVAGSDAHRPKDVGRYFDMLPDLLGEIKLSLSPKT